MAAGDSDCIRCTYDPATRAASPLLTQVQGDAHWVGPCRCGRRSGDQCASRARRRTWPTTRHLNRGGSFEILRRRVPERRSSPIDSDSPSSSSGWATSCRDKYTRSARPCTTVPWFYVILAKSLRWGQARTVALDGYGDVSETESGQGQVRAGGCADICRREVSTERSPAGAASLLS